LQEGGRSLPSAVARQVRRPCYDIHRKAPLAGLQIIEGRSRGRLAWRGLNNQSVGLAGAGGFVLGLHPYRVGFAAGRFAVRPQPALGRAFQERFEEWRCNVHGGGITR
jgi:hypothetical protein